MPQVETPFQFGDTTLTAAEAASACGPAAAVAFARANGRNPTLREAVDLARRVGWTEAGGMNGVANQKRLLDAMGVSADLDTSGDTGRITRAARSGQMVTISTPIHYYVVDDYDPATDRLHVGNSGRARKGGGEWMTLAQISSRDGGVNGALYQTMADTQTGSSATTSGGEMDRPPSTFEPPSQFGPGATGTGSGPVTRADRMRARIAELRSARSALASQIATLDRPGADETPQGDLPSDIESARQARRNRVDQRAALVADARAIDAEISRTATDLANDPDAKPPTAASAGTTVATSANEPYIVTRKPDGSITREPNPNYVPPKPGASRTVATSANEPFIVRELPDGTISTEPNPNYKPDKPRTSTHTINGRIVTVDDQGRVLSTSDMRTPEEIEGAQVALAGAKQKLLPDQLRAMQAHQETVKYLQGMLERGEIDQTQADAYVRLSREAAEAGMRGTTPYQEAQERRTGQQNRQKMGIDLLNQRLSSGQGLASSLLSSASSLANNAMLRPGQTSLGVDPLAQLLPLLQQLQGGADVTPFARGLLMGGQEPAPEPLSPLAGLTSGL